MTILTSQTVVGIDIAKAEIVVYRADLETIEAVKNDRAALKRWLKTLPAQSAIASKPPISTIWRLLIWLMRWDIRSMWWMLIESATIVAVSVSEPKMIPAMHACSHAI